MINQSKSYNLFIDQLTNYISNYQILSDGVNQQVTKNQGQKLKKMQKNQDDCAKDDQKLDISNVSLNVTQTAQSLQEKNVGKPTRRNYQEDDDDWYTNQTNNDNQDQNKAQPVYGGSGRNFTQSRGNTRGNNFARAQPQRTNNRGANNSQFKRRKMQHLQQIQRKQNQNKSRQKSQKQQNKKQSSNSQQQNKMNKSGNWLSSSQQEPKKGKGRGNRNNRDSNLSQATESQQSSRNGRGSDINKNQNKTISKQKKKPEHEDEMNCSILKKQIEPDGNKQLDTSWIANDQKPAHSNQPSSTTATSGTNRGNRRSETEPQETQDPGSTTRGNRRGNRDDKDRQRSRSFQNRDEGFGFRKKEPYNDGNKDGFRFQNSNRNNGNYNNYQGRGGRGGYRGGRGGYNHGRKDYDNNANQYNRDRDRSRNDGQFRSSNKNNFNRDRNYNNDSYNNRNYRNNRDNIDNKDNTGNNQDSNTQSVRGNRYNRDRSQNKQQYQAYQHTTRNYQNNTRNYESRNDYNQNRNNNNNYRSNYNRSQYIDKDRNDRDKNYYNNNRDNGGNETTRGNRYENRNDHYYNGNRNRANYDHNNNDSSNSYASSFVEAEKKAKNLHQSQLQQTKQKTQSSSTVKPVQTQPPKKLVITPRGQKCWPQMSIYIMQTRLSFSYRQITQHQCDMLIIPYRDLKFDVYPGNIINKCKADYRKKIHDKGKEIEEIGYLYPQMCVGVPNFKALGFLKLGKGTNPAQIKSCINGILPKLKQLKISISSVLIPYSKQLGSAKQFLRTIIESIAKFEGFSEINISTNNAEDFRMGMKILVDEIEGYMDENKICIDF